MLVRAIFAIFHKSGLGSIVCNSSGSACSRPVGRDKYGFLCGVDEAETFKVDETGTLILRSRGGRVLSAVAMEDMAGSLP